MFFYLSTVCPSLRIRQSPLGLLLLLRGGRERPQQWWRRRRQRLLLPLLLCLGWHRWLGRRRTEGRRHLQGDTQVHRWGRWREVKSPLKFGDGKNRRKNQRKLKSISFQRPMKKIGTQESCFNVMSTMFLYISFGRERAVVSLDPEQTF